MLEKLFESLFQKCAIITHSVVLLFCHNIYYLKLSCDKLLHEHTICTICYFDNTPMLYTAIFHICKNDIFLCKNVDIFLIFAQNIIVECEYLLEPPELPLKAVLYVHPCKPYFSI